MVIDNQIDSENDMEIAHDILLHYVEQMQQDIPINVPISSPKKYQSAQVVGDSQPDDLVECCPALHEAHQPLDIDCPIPT